MQGFAGIERPGVYSTAIQADRLHWLAAVKRRARKAATDCCPFTVVLVWWWVQVWRSVEQKRAQLTEGIDALADGLKCAEEAFKQDVQSALQDMVAAMSDIAHLDEGRVQRITEQEAAALNQQLLENRYAVLCRSCHHTRLQQQAECPRCSRCAHSMGLGNRERMGCLLAAPVTVAVAGVLHQMCCSSYMPTRCSRSRLGTSAGRRPVQHGAHYAASMQCSAFASMSGRIWQSRQNAWHSLGSCVTASKRRTTACSSCVASCTSLHHHT